jgi:serine/threonine protein kinase
VKTAAQHNAALPDGLEIGGYRIVKKIAAGGFSMVYLAADSEGRPVAIKEYLPGSLVRRRAGQRVPEIVEDRAALYRLGMKYFFDEGRALAAITHPNVVRVLNFFRAHDTVYLVMAYEQGRSLQELIAHRRRQQRRPLLSERSIRLLFLQLMDALREVHTHKLLHLDLKPANIYLRNDGTPILLDFGAARQPLQADPRQLHPIYTPGFAAPELDARSALGPWTDVYGIGASIYCCMLGSPPPAAAERRHGDDLNTTLLALRSDYSETLIGLVHRSLALDPLQRPQSVYALQKLIRPDTAPHSSAGNTGSPSSLLSRLWRAWQ